MIVIPRITSKQISFNILRTFLNLVAQDSVKIQVLKNTILQKSPKENDWLINFVNDKGPNEEKIDIAVGYVQCL